MNLSGIYAIRNGLNGKAYIGSALNMRKRWSLHRSLLTRGTHHAQPLQRAWAKYGEASFVFEVLEVISDPTALIEREQVWLDGALAEGRAYNAAKVAGSRLGMKSPAETRAKIAAKARGRTPTPEARAKMRAAALARSPEVAERIAASRPSLVHTDETKARVSAKLRGIRRSPETRAKMSAASTGRKHSPETTAKRLETLRRNKALKGSG